MDGKATALERAMGHARASGPDPSWGEIMGELWPVISSPLSSDGERLLLNVIRHRGRLHLADAEGLPHSLPPDEMLKSLAVQALARWTGLTYLMELRQLELAAPSSALRSSVRAVVRAALAARPQGSMIALPE